MPDAYRILLATMLENALLKKKGQAFEDFFVKAGTTLWGQDFRPWRSQGSVGDMKCDGYLNSEKTVFQCHAPEQFDASKVANKIRADLTGAIKYFGDKLQKWVFVHNHNDGLPAKANMLVLELTEQNPSIAIEIWTPNVLIQKLLKLPIKELGSLFPALVRDQELSDPIWEVMKEEIKKKTVPAIRVDVEPPDRPNRLVLDITLENLDENDREVRRRVLGYSRWYDPASKDQVIQKLALIGHDLELVENNAQRLHDANLIQITENHYLPRNEEICQQAAESLMAEFLQELEE